MPELTEQEIRQQEEDAALQEAVKRGQQASSLLSHPLLSEFFDHEEKSAFAAFRKLPATATIEEFKYIQARIDVVLKLKNTLESYQSRAKDMLLMSQRPDEP